MTNQAWRIYYSDALAKTELTQSPARVKWAKEQGHRVVRLVEDPLNYGREEDAVEALSKIRDMLPIGGFSGELGDILLECCSFPESVPKLVASYLRSIGEIE